LLSVLLGVSPWAGAVQQVPTYHIDQKAYFDTPTDEASLRQKLVADIAMLKAPTVGDAPALLDYLHQCEALLGLVHRHSAYLHLRAALDIDDTAAVDAKNEIDNAADRLVDGAHGVLRAWGDDGFATAVKQQPALASYRYVLSRAERGLPHELPPAEQAILEQVAEPAADSYWTIYQQTQRGIDFGKVHTAQGDQSVDKDAKAIALDPDRGVRQQAWQQRWDAYNSRAGTFASLLLSIVRLNDRTAHLQHFDDAPSAAYFSRQFDRKNVDETIAATARHADILQRYQTLRASRVAALTGLGDVQPWDMGMAAQGFTPPAFSYEQMRNIAHQALAPLGSAYVTRFDALLDPANRRIDLSPELGKRVNDAFSVSAPGVLPGLFVSRYAGDLGSASVIVHEGGHAMHAQLMDEHGTSPFYIGGPSWMKEATAILNEFLLRDYLYRHATDAQSRAYYLQSLLDDMTLEIFTSAEEGELEQSIYDGVVAGKLRSASDLDALALKITGRYEIWPAKQPRLAHVWMTKRLMYEDPLYLANYLYAGLFAAKMYDMAQRDPKEFQSRYTAFLQNGFDDSPQGLLRRFFGKDVSPESLVDEDMALIERKLDELEKVYRDDKQH
jgi:oligoendopeptidase F